MPFLRTTNQLNYLAVIKNKSLYNPEWCIIAYNNLT